MRSILLFARCYLTPPIRFEKEARQITKRLPYFPFYPSDFIADANVKLMSNEAIGCYTILMCYEWIETGIPSDMTKLAKLVDMEPSKFRRIWEYELKHCFKNGGIPGKLVHPRLQLERDKIDKRKKRLSDAGKKGATKRWGNGN